jgi:hypothetical protein
MHNASFYCVLWGPTVLTCMFSNSTGLFSGLEQVTASPVLPPANAEYSDPVEKTGLQK